MEVFYGIKMFYFYLKKIIVLIFCVICLDFLGYLFFFYIIFDFLLVKLVKFCYRLGLYSLEFDLVNFKLVV